MTIKYVPMACLAKGRVSVWRDENGAELQGEGEVKCELCERQFLYKLEPVVTCVTAKLPTYS